MAEFPDTQDSEVDTINWVTDTLREEGFTDAADRIIFLYWGVEKDE